MDKQKIYQSLTLPMLLLVVIVGSTIEAEPLWGGVATLAAVVLLGWVVHEGR